MRTLGLKMGMAVIGIGALLAGCTPYRYSIKGSAEPSSLAEYEEDCAKSDDARGCYALAIVYRDGLIGMVDLEKADKYFARACTLDHDFCGHTGGDRFTADQMALAEKACAGVATVSREQYDAWLADEESYPPERAEWDEFVDRCSRAAGILLWGEGASQAPETARRFAAVACETGRDGRACGYFGLMALMGLGGPSEPERARAALERACEASAEPNRLACGYLGRIHEFGLAGRPVDLEKATSLYEAACPRDSDGEPSGAGQACLRLGHLRNSGEYYRAACFDDEDRFARALGCYHSASYPLSDAYSEHVQWVTGMTASCSAGYGPACTALFDDREERDRREAAELFAAASGALGDAIAQAQAVQKPLDDLDAAVAQMDARWRARQSASSATVSAAATAPRPLDANKPTTGGSNAANATSGNGNGGSSGATAGNNGDPNAVKRAACMARYKSCGSGDPNCVRAVPWSNPYSVPASLISELGERAATCPKKEWPKCTEMIWKTMPNLPELQHAAKMTEARFGKLPPKFVAGAPPLPSTGWNVITLVKDSCGADQSMCPAACADAVKYLEQVARLDEFTYNAEQAVTQAELKAAHDAECLRLFP